MNEVLLRRLAWACVVAGFLALLVISIVVPIPVLSASTVLPEDELIAVPVFLEHVAPAENGYVLSFSRRQELPIYVEELPLPIEAHSGSHFLITGRFDGNWFSLDTVSPLD